MLKRSRWPLPDVLLGVAVAVLGSPFAVVFQPALWVTVLVFAVFVALVPVIAMRRKRATLCVAAGLAAAAVLMAITPVMSLHIGLVVAVTVHSAAARLSSRWMWVTLSLVASMVVIAVAFRPHTPALIIGAVVTLAIAAVAALTGLLNRREREHNEQLLALQRSEERAAVARELHDIVAHSLGVIAVQAEGARYAGGDNRQLEQETLERVAAIARTSLRRVRELVVALRSQDEQLALIQDGFDQIAEVIRNIQAAGLEISAALPQPWPEADMLVQVTVNRILTEGLSNAVRHGCGPASLDVRVLGEMMVIEICNPCSRSSKESGMGLAGLQERAQLIGGRLNSAPDPTGEMWLLTAEIPLS
ncbi:sensor histidine kinase [Dermatophilus congolensis]|uniref:sensor histidine kinase n=1 Tax=Dermatophilus congolensis TaxID=1863 RepID=UPI001AAE76DD|nr:histidine kinase [Dermatophilus congolensis]MBO3169487.1 hypothetical protein [Dermatophilus congolensis]